MSLTASAQALSGVLAGRGRSSAVDDGLLTVMWFELTTFALIVTVVGGLGSVAGASAGVLLGVAKRAERHDIGQDITTIILLGVVRRRRSHPPRGPLG